jgi:DNA-binding SARP family transcriptional activator/tetratricopeptide (TPR) repeat protein
MVARAPQQDDGLTLRLVGEFAVLRHARPLPVQEIGSRKARTLLKLLAVEPDRWVHIDRIVEALWGADWPQRPADNVATLVSRLRCALGEFIVDGGRDGYRLGLAPAVEVDVAMAERDVDQARQRSAAGDHALAAAAATRALATLGDGRALIGDGDADWAGPVRTAVAALLREARNLAGEAALAVGTPATARGLATAAIAADPLDEPANRLLMRADVAAGEPARALTAYERLRQVLATELGVDPAPETRDLHGAILREEATPAKAIAATAPIVPLLAGRADATRMLVERWSAAAGGVPSLVLIAGEAGIGKTRLGATLEKIAASTGGAVIRARCYEAERSLFLQPFVEALGEHAAAANPATIRAAIGDWAGPLVSLVPQIAAIVEPLPLQLDRGEIARRRSYEAFARYICRLADRPMLLVLDDLHQAGLATIELLHYLVRKAGDARLLVVATVRSEDGADVLASLADVGERLDLGPLPPDAVAQLAADAGHAELADSISARTGGHTLFVVETLRGIAVGDPSIPSSLQAAVLARVRRAGDSTAALLRAAAVLGAAIEPNTLASMLDIAPVDSTDRCEHALTARLLVVADRTYEFANDLIREVLYESTPLPTRVAYHRRAADLKSDHPEAVGTHAAAAGDWGRAARAWLLAGEQAGARVAFADAGVLLTNAIDAAERSGDGEVAGRAYLARGRARGAQTRYPEALSDLERAAELARQTGDRRLEMMTLRELSMDVPVSLGSPLTECATNLHKGLKIAEALGDRVNESGILGRLAVTASSRLRFTDALAFGQRAVRAARAGGNDVALARALDGLKTAYAYLGEIEPLEPIIAELEPLLRAQGDLWRLPWTVQESAFPALATGRWDDALARMTEALDLNRRSGYLAYEAWFVGNIGWVHRLRGDLDQALSHGRQAVELTRNSTHAWWRSAACTQLAGTLLATGDTATAIEMLTVGRGYASQEGAEAYLLSCLASLAYATGDRSILDEAMALLNTVDTPDGSAWILGVEAYVAIGRALLAHGEPALAHDTVAPLRAAAQRIGWWWVRDAAADILATADQPGTRPLEPHRRSAPARMTPLAPSRRR